MYNDTIDINEAAQILNFTNFTVRNLARSGKIPATKVGARWRFSRITLTNLITNNSNTSTNTNFSKNDKRKRPNK